MQLRVWTRAYRPFIMGGDVNAPVSTYVETGEPVVVAHGVTLYPITAPDGRTFVAEGITGGIVGPSIEAVKEDIAATDARAIRKQLITGLKKVKTACAVDADEFWKALPVA